MKSLLKMLFVAGVFAVSLVGVQEDAAADTQLASWYGPGLEGNLTASGDVFEPYTELTAASLYYPFGTELLVTYGGYSTVVTVTDRGPYVAGREIDLCRVLQSEPGYRQRWRPPRLDLAHNQSR